MKRLLLLFIFPIIISSTALAQCPITIQDNSPLCYGYPGWASVTATGIPPLTYQWSNGNQNAYLSEVPVGTYYVTVTDSIGCVAIDSVVFTEAPMLSLIVDSIHNETCFGLKDGEAWIHGLGGIPPYRYDWYNGQDSSYASGLTAMASYYPNVYDSLGCYASTSVYIISPPQIYFSESITPSYCSNSTGFINPNTSGGTPYTQSVPYTYQWSCITNAVFTSTTENIFSLESGIYSLTVTDSIGCKNSKIFVLNTSDGPQPQVNFSNVLCNGQSNGAVTSISNNTPVATCLWSNGFTIWDPTNVNLPQNLAIGDYWVSVSTPIGCNGFNYFTITEPIAITDNPFQQNVSCYGDTTGYISLSVQGGNPGQVPPYYHYQWNTGDSTDFVTYVPAGPYSVTVTDLNGCAFIENFNITSPAVLFIDSLGISNISCNGANDGSFTIFASGGTFPYFYSLDSISWDTISHMSSLLPNVPYHIFIKDVNYCHTSSQDFTLTEPTFLDVPYVQVDPTCVGNNGSIEITPTGATPPYSIVWDTPGLTGFIETGLVQGLYYATVTDVNNCQNSLFFELIQYSQPAVLTGKNFYSGGDILPNELKIFLFKPAFTGAAQMDTVAETSNSASVWQFNGLLPGTYFVKANFMNPASYPTLLNSYYDTTYKWQNAAPIILSCDDTTHINFFMYEIIPQTTGNGSVSGTVMMVPPPKSGKAVGEPVPGAEILIEQEPNDVPVQCAFTDSTGYYEFNGLNPGPGYKLLVDIPGFPLLSTYQHITVTSNDTVPNLNFLVDSTSSTGGIYKDTASYVSYISCEGISAEIYPNPFTSCVNVKIKLDNSIHLSSELFDALGRKIQSLDSGLLSAGEHEFKIIPQTRIQGPCYLIVHAGNSTIVKKLISVQK